MLPGREAGLVAHNVRATAALECGLPLILSKGISQGADVKGLCAINHTLPPYPQEHG